MACLAVPATAAAQKKTTSSRPGSAAFRCDFVSPSAECTALVAVDPIRGDHSGYAGTGVPETGEGAHLTSGGELWVGIGSGGYQLEITIPETALDDPSGLPPCASSGTCRLLNHVILIDQVNAEIQSNVLSPSTGSDTATLSQMPVTSPPATWRSRLQFSFYDPWGRDLLWGLDFNPLNYSTSTPLNVTRAGACTWVFEPAAGDRAGLRAYGTTAAGKRTRTDEGLYAMPFRLTFTVPSLCPAP
jgi:hypothetical protein